MSASLYIQDNPPQGIWTAVEHDIGADLTNVTVNFTYVNQTVPTTVPPTWTVEMMGSTQAQGPAGGAWTTGASQFFATVRYIIIRITIDVDVGDPQDSMGMFFNANVVIAVKNVVDGNNIACLAGDTEGDAGEEGTMVRFPRHAGYVADGGAGAGNGTKNFTDIRSITLAPKDTIDQAVTAIFDFVDVVDPEYFTILCFDSAGRRVDATVGWKVRGIKT